MAIWRKKETVSTKGKRGITIACVLFIVCIGISVFSAITLFKGIYAEAYKESYCDTYEYNYEYLIPKAGYIRDLIVRYPNESVFDKNTINIEDYRNYFKREAYIENVSNQTEVTQQAVPTDKETTVAIQEQKEVTDSGKETNDAVIIENQEAMEAEIERVKEQVIKDRKVYYRLLQQELNEQKLELDYYAKNNTTNRVITNIEIYDGKNERQVIEYLEQQKGYLLGDERGYYKDGSYHTSSKYAKDSMAIPYVGDDFEIHIAARVSGDTGSKQGENFYQLKQCLGYSVFALIIGVFGMIASLFYLTYGVKKEETSAKGLVAIVDRIPFEVQFIVGAIITLIAGISNYVLVEQAVLGSYNLAWDMAYIMVIAVISMGLGSVLLVIYLSVVRHLKAREFMKNTLFYKISKLLMQEKLLYVCIGVVFIVYSLINLVLCGLLWGEFSVLLYLTVLGLVVAGVVGVTIMEYKKILKGIKRIEEGDLDYQIQTNTKISIFKPLISGINHIREGLANSVEQKLKSEKFKTELITNVSHDLKTPLTSIISYIELLKEESLENSQAKEYVDVIGASGEKLKILIYDLVEASKAVSGNVKVTMEEVELSQFLQQAVGEYMDRLEMKDLTVVLKQQEDLIVRADGKHLSRIMENLLSNINKYALPHTRVYIETLREENYVNITMKNVSEEQLEIDVEHLTERFVRGDQARNKEGSGLGLSIAKSLIELQKGRLEIAVDGDLFKVTIKMPV